MDGIGKTGPRSFLRALTRVKGETRDKFAGHEFALHYDGIRRGVQTVSSTRVAEIAEDLPWVEIAVKPLTARQVPTDRQDVIEAWQETDLSAAQQRSSEDLGEFEVSTGPRNADDYGEFIDSLVEIDINGRLDLPDA